MRLAPLALLYPLSLLLLGGCSEPVWYGDVQPIVAEHCGSCHTPGGVAPHDLTDAETAQALAGSMAAAIEDGSMPPWPQDPDCSSFQGERVLTGAEIQRISAWAAAGGPLGAASESVEPPAADDPLAGMGAPDLSLSPAIGHTPDPSRPDDYHCFFLDHVFEEDTWVQLYQVEPDIREQLHHAIIYRVQPDAVAAAQALDEGAGYTCFGGPEVDAQFVGAWVPGWVDRPMEEGSAWLFPQGSAVVLQMHYNTDNAEPMLDRTGLNLWFTERPEQMVEVVSLSQTGLAIPAGAPDVSFTQEMSNPAGSPVTLVGVGPHMHQIGVSTRLERLDRNGPERCLSDIPRWDFQWQQFYRYPVDQRPVLQPGERLRLTCDYDNSMANQPIVNGVQIEPRDVGWGEGSLDEMCITYLEYLRPVPPL